MIPIPLPGRMPDLVPSAPFPASARGVVESGADGATWPATEATADGENTDDDDEDRRCGGAVGGIPCAP